MLSLQTIRPDTLELLKIIASESIFSETRLVGGTSLALQYGHRQSIDLNFSAQLKTMLQLFGNVSPILETFKSSKNPKTLKYTLSTR